MAHPIPESDRILELMIALARCSNLHRIVVAGASSVELMFDLHRRGYARATGSAYCGRPVGQYDVALVDWRRRTVKELGTMLSWWITSAPPACWSSGSTLRSPRTSKACAPRSKSGASSWRPEPRVKTATPSRRGDATRSRKSHEIRP